MKKNIRFGNILDVTEGVLIHGTNARGVMGSGIALQIKEKYPTCFTAYVENLSIIKRAGNNPLGIVIPYVDNKLHILNAVTQENFGREPGKRYVDYRAVQQVFEIAGDYCQSLNLCLHYPMIGAGLGGGDWSLISEIIDVAVPNEVERTLWIYEK